MPETDELLLTKASHGDDDAMATLLQKYGPQVRRRITGRIADRFRSAFDEDDVMQVTYLEAFLRTDGFAPKGIGGFVAWLTRIAENNLRDAVKELQRAKRPPREKRVTAVSDDSYVSLLETLGNTTTTASRHAQQHEAKSILESCLRQLPPDYRKVVQLQELEGRPAAEVAETMGRTVGAIYMLRARAHARLLELLPSASRILGGSA